jgi:hypothetical protein
MKDERNVCAEHYLETGSVLSIGHVGSATRRHIRPISTSGLILLFQKSGINSSTARAGRAQCMEH